MELIPEDWSKVLWLETPLLELMLRGVILYAAIIVFMRVLPRRTGGEAMHVDLIFVLIIAEAAAHSLGDYTTVADGLVVIVTIMGLNYLLNWLTFRFRVVERLVSHRPLEIVRDGERLDAHLKREFLTDEELVTFLRQNGVEDISQVKIAVVEGKGTISIVKHVSS